MTDVRHLTLDRVKATERLESGLCPPHLAPILIGIRDHDVAQAVVLPFAGRWRLPTGKPVVAILGDDLATAVINGPRAFDEPSIRRFARSCKAAFIIASAPPVELYARAAAEAVVGRRNTLIIETRPRFEGDWLDVIGRAGKHLQVHLSTSPGEGNA